MLKQKENKYILSRKLLPKNLFCLESTKEKKLHNTIRNEKGYQSNTSKRGQSTNQQQNNTELMRRSTCMRREGIELK